MQILTSPQSLASARPSVTAVSKEQPKASAQTRPLTEKWNVDGETFQSTADLVASGKTYDKVQANYRYTTEETRELSTGTRVKNAIGTGLMGAVGGAVGGAFLGALGGLMSDVANILTFQGGAGGSTELLIPVVGGAVIGGVWAALEGFKDKGEAAVEKITGTLSGKGESLAFYPNGRVQNEVSLGEFQTAKTPELAGKEATPVNGWKSALKGAGLGVASTIPLVNYVAPAYLGAGIGAQLDKGSRLGSGIGLALGAGATVGIMAATVNFGWAGLAASAGVMGLAGAILAPQTAKAAAAEVAQPSRDFGSQWWNKTVASAQPGLT